VILWGAREQLLLLLGKLQAADRKLLAHSHMQLGNIAQKLGNNDARVHHFAEATKVAPRLELASLGLYHSLWARETGTQLLTRWCVYCL
jgi:hypothetical protein